MPILNKDVYLNLELPDNCDEDQISICAEAKNKETVEHEVRNETVAVCFFVCLL